MKNAERAWPCTSGSRKCFFCSGVPTLPSRYMLPSSGAAVLQASGPSGDRPLFFRTCAVSRWVRCAAVGQDVRRQHAGCARLAAHLGHEFIGRSVARPPRIVLVGDDRLPDKRLDPIGDLVRAGGWVGHRPLLCLPSELVGKDAGLIQPLADGRAAPGHAWDYRIGAMADQRFSGTCGAGSAFAPGYDETPAPEFFGA